MVVNRVKIADVLIQYILLINGVFLNVQKRIIIPKNNNGIAVVVSRDYYISSKKKSSFSVGGRIARVYAQTTTYLFNNYRTCDRAN